VPKPCEFKGSGDAHGGQSILKIDPNPHPCERISAGIHMGRKIMNRRTLTTMVLLGLAVATALPQIGFAQTDPFPGTWQLNLTKSKYSPGPPRKSSTVTVQAVGQNHKLTGVTTDAEGKQTSVENTRIYYGMSHPVLGNPDYDAGAFTRVDAYTIIISYMKAGKLVRTATNVVSQDGKTITATATGTDARGRQVNNISIYDKQ
jgi:hypothetical protein